MIEIDRSSAIHQLPKVELHVHLEGSIRPETLLKLASRNGVLLPATTLEELKQWYQFTNFAHFVDVYVAASGAIQKPEDLELIAHEFALGQLENNVLYTEAHFTAQTIFASSGIGFDEQLDALNRGLSRVKGTQVRWILDIVRGWTPDVCDRVVAWCSDYRTQGVCALGLSGFELEHPVTHESRAASAHSSQFASAKSAGIPITAHCGETKGADSIREVLDVVNPDRIGHGVRCVEDPYLLADIRDRQIHLEVNPSSNVCLGVFPSLQAHSLPKLLDEGVSLSINTDDPPMFGTNITQEFIKCADAFDLSLDILYSLGLGAINATFLPLEEKSELRLQYQTLANLVME